MVSTMDCLGTLRAGERFPRVSQVGINTSCERMRTTEHAPRDPGQIIERFHGLAEMVERGAVVQARPAEGCQL